MDQKILPVLPSMKEFEDFLKSPFEIGVLMEMHVAQLKNVHMMAEAHKKKILFHVDLINGLKNDEYATEYLCQEFNPYGLISTKSSVILKAKQKGVLAVQRIFLIDSHALEKSIKLLKKTKPDYIEVLPGVMPFLIKEVKKLVDIPIFTGGFIKTPEEVKNVLEAGAITVTTSNKELWQTFSK
ncbi:glycerol-3-phosphate responsive antiterminator [Alkalihalobacillus deserti]|uniref:glycerol-3-phosphate responsive antiterminator n=1 Tax=Alkalihalobacillus deserti TaxID=2879466 RepID=UPI001D15916C|nr:glycerol-3-phosphate responsive antiterminator [Alkalihalobacillus deserti]